MTYLSAIRDADVLFKLRAKSKQSDAAAMDKPNAQGTRAEEESIPRQGRCGTSGHGWH